MINISDKIFSHRIAIAEAIVITSNPETIKQVKNKTVPKGDVLETARTAGLFGVKRTSDMIPDCHPLPVEYAKISFEISGLEIKILVEVHTVYKTGVEVEAMHGASVTALTIYDMLKPIDKEIVIASIRLLEKSGGKSDFKDSFPNRLKAAVIVCSDSIHSKKKKDKAGKVICEKLSAMSVDVSDYVIIPDEKDIIQNTALKYCKEKIDMVLITGGTGLSSRDTTPEAIRPIIEKEIPGIMEAARNYGQMRTPYSMLSRGIAGTRGDTLILTLPGSTRGAGETINALFPYLLHLFRIIKNVKHEKESYA